MNIPKRLALLLAATALILPLVRNPLRADQVPADQDRTESPYFQVRGDGSEHFPLEATDAEVDIAGVIAEVTLRQVYRNRGKTPIEATYVFPASTRAAVHGMTMQVGDRVITAKVKRKAEAREDFEQAKQQGKTASLLEEHRPNVFQMNVANILPGDRIEVTLRYTEMLIPTDRTYEFVLPTVVGPRFEGSPEADAETWVKNPYLDPAVKHPTAPTQPRFGFAARIRGGMPLSEVTSPSHPLKVRYVDKTACEVALQPASERGDDRDLVLRYRLAGDTINTGLLLHRGDKENFFTLMLQPPARPTLADIPARDYVFIVDVSGSMRGFPLTVTKELMRDLLGSLRPDDTFNVLLFAGGSHTLAEEPLRATPANISQATTFVDRQGGGGGTNLLPALRRGLGLPRGDGVSRNIVVVTDGYVTVEAEAFDLIRENLNQANVFAFGIGSSVNRHLIEGLARVGRGEAFVALNPQKAATQAKRFEAYVSRPVLTQVKLAFEGFDAYDIEPPVAADILADRPVVVVGKWRGQPAGTIRLEGESGGGPYEQTLEVADYAGTDTLPALPYLWARERIATLVDYNRLSANDERVTEATNLGLTYNLLTPYTSFIAVDQVVRNTTGQPGQNVKQPLPLPKGVEASALSGGTQVAVTPEPETWGMIIIGAAVAGWMLYRRHRAARHS